MRVLTLDAVIHCQHRMGTVKLTARQDFCTIAKRPILIDDDPEKKSISGCPNINPALGLKPCTETLRVQVGYSTFVRIAGRAVCLDTVTGLTTGTPQGTVKYVVAKPGQEFVASTQ